MARNVSCIIRFPLLFSTFLSVVFLSNFVAAQNSQEYESALNRLLNDPSNSEASFRFAQIASEEGDLRGTISALERILLLNPDLANIKLELGVLYLQAGSPDLAKKYISEALTSPDAPEDVKRTAEDFLEIARDQSNPWQFGGFVSAGIVADTNANSGPTSGVLPEDTDQSDFSAFVQVSGEFSYDMGRQAGHQIIGSASYYGRRYSEQTQIDSDRLGFSLGGLFNLAPTGEHARSLSATFDAAIYKRGGEDFLFEYGPKLAFGFDANEKTSGEASFFILHQDYKNTSSITVNDERDGEFYGTSFSIARQLSDRSQLVLGVDATLKDAAVNYESYAEVSLSSQYAVIHDAFFSLGADKWKSSFNASVGFRYFDGPDVFAGFFSRERSTNYNVSASFEIPFKNNVALVTEIGFEGNTSNLAINEYENTYVSLGMSKAF